jgi:hypothetical protein
MGFNEPLMLVRRISRIRHSPVEFPYYHVRKYLQTGKDLKEFAMKEGGTGREHPKT